MCNKIFSLEQRTLGIKKTLVSIPLPYQNDQAVTNGIKDREVPGGAGLHLHWLAPHVDHEKAKGIPVWVFAKNIGWQRSNTVPAYFPVSWFSDLERCRTVWKSSLTGRVQAQLLQDLTQWGWDTGELEFLDSWQCYFLVLLMSLYQVLCYCELWVVSMFKSIQPQCDTHPYSHMWYSSIWLPCDTHPYSHRAILIPMAAMTYLATVSFQHVLFIEPQS